MANHDVSNPTFNPDLRKFETTDPGHADVFNAVAKQLINNDVALATQLKDMMYEVAGGTATAITLNMPVTLKDGYWKKFIASADNNGAATTINGKPFYKVCSTNPPNLKKDRPYEAYYNLTGDCFFLKASATGTTSADKVLAGETFSTENDTDSVGTMPERGAPSVILNAGGTYNLQEGHYTGGKIQVNSMATQMANNGVTLTSASQLANGAKAYSKSGTLITGTALIREKITKNINVSNLLFDLSSSTKCIYFINLPEYVDEDTIITINITSLTYTYTYNGYSHTNTLDTANKIYIMSDTSNLLIYTLSLVSGVTTGSITAVTGTYTIHHNI